MLVLAFVGLIQLATAIADGNLPPADLCAENQECNSVSVDLKSVPNAEYKIEDIEDYLPYGNAHNLTYLSGLIEVHTAESLDFDPEEVISEWAANMGVDLNNEPTAYQEPPVVDNPPTAAMGRRTDQDSWAERAQKSGEAAYLSSWQKWVSILGKATDTVAIAQQPKLCTQLTRSTVDGCKKGVRTQVAYCKQALRDNIAKCKNDVRRWVDNCKKQNKLIPGGSALCEFQRLEKMGECEGRRIDVPFCELDRLTATCCEGTRPQVQGMCAAGVSPAKLQEQTQKVQATCAIVTAIAKSAIKSYLSGQALGILNDVQSIKQLGQTVQTIKKIQATRDEYQKWADGLTAAAEGRLGDAQRALGSLATKIVPSINNAVAWAAAAEAAVTQNVDKFLAQAAKAAGEIDQIKVAKDSIDKLKTVANDIKAIRIAATECAKVPLNITPDQYPGWKTVSSSDTLHAAVEEYKKFYSQALFAAARCRAVVIRAERLVLS